MKAYRLYGLPREERAPYYPTLKLAHDEAKDLQRNFKWASEDSRIELVEFKTDQATLCEILSGWGCDMKVLRTWALTPRGGLKEVPNGE